MAHIHTKPGQHDHTVSAYIVRTDFSEPKFMLHMHKKLHRYMQFGGHIELDENPWQTLIHELREESGYDISQLQLLQPPQRLKSLTGSVLHPVPLAYRTHPFGDIDHFHSDLSFVFVALQPPQHPVAANESQDIRLFTLEELGSHPQTIVDVDEIAHFIIKDCLPTWETVDTSHFS